MSIIFFIILLLLFIHRFLFFARAHTVKYAIARISYIIIIIIIQVDSSGMFNAYPPFFHFNNVFIQISIFEIFNHTYKNIILDHFDLYSTYYEIGVSCVTTQFIFQMS